MAKFCSNCGKEVDEKAVVCVGCGVAIGETPIAKVADKTPKKGKGIASMILGIVGLFFALAAFTSLSELDTNLDFITGESAYRFGFALGFVLIQLSTSITGFCLAISERKKNKNGFNTAGLWLCLITIIIAAIQFILVIIH